MKKQILVVGVVGASLLVWAAKPTDPVLMNIAGKDVRLSEFEYLYHKNSAQQAQPQSIDEYVNMFVDYKLKVADAEAAGLDTTADFRKEFGQFRTDLSRPYLRDTTVLDAMVDEVYSHMATERLVSHIMLPEGKEQILDSLRAAIQSGTTTFEDVARGYSIDKPSAGRGGLMGYVIPNRYPWPFEKAAYETAVGGISPVVNSGFGIHLIRVESERPAKGEVLVEHILRLTRGVPDSVAAQEEVRIDSIYNVVTAEGADFSEVAARLSQDPGSARRGGKLDWFGAGTMVEEFDSVSFALPVGGYSKPFRTSYGWHIVHKLDARGIPSKEESREGILATLSRDDRGQEPNRAFLKQQVLKSKVKTNKDAQTKIALLAEKLGNELDSAMIAGFAKSNIEIYKIGGKSITLADVAAKLTPTPVRGSVNVASYVMEEANYYMNDVILDNAREDLYNNNADYRNLINEYRDGILLFEISNRNVWDRASKDPEGVEAYFEAHRAKYAWSEPKFKSVILFAPNDSLLNEALSFAESLPETMSTVDAVKEIRDKYGREVKVERVIAAKGENAITDYLAFDGPKPADNGRWNFYAKFRGKVIPAPEEATDVRGAVVSDYQNELESEWIKTLHEKYPVKINKNVLEQVK